MSTQSPHNFKPLYEFTIEVLREIEKEETRQEGDKTVTVKTKVKEPVPQFFCFKKLSRAEREEADLYRASQWALFVKKGVLPEALLLRDYTNGGGILSEEDSKRWIQLRADLVEKMREYQLLQIDKETDKARQTSKDILVLRDEIIALQNQQNVFFENTAEARARNKLTIYLALMFTFTKSAPDKPWEHYFKGGNIEEKLKALEDLEESEDETFPKVWDRIQLLSVLYISAGGAITKDEIDSFDKEFNVKPNVSSGVSTFPDVTSGDAKP